MKAISLTLVAAAATLVLFETTSLDIAIQRLFYDAASAQWLVSKEAPLARMIFYDLPRLMVIAVGFGALVGAAAAIWRPAMRPYLPGLLTVLLAVILVPSTVGLLKNLTNVACPSHLIPFGGDIPYVGVLDSYPAGLRPDGRQRCFPAGHASGIYALMALALLFQARRTRILVTATALCAGTAAALYKQAIGDHFLSHTLITLEIAILEILVLKAAIRHYLDRSTPGREVADRFSDR